MKKILYPILIAGAMTFLGGCKKDYLDVAPKEKIGTSQAVATTSNAMGALNGIAKAMSTQHSGYGQGASGETRIIRLMENYLSENYYFNAYASGWAPLHNMTLLANKTSHYTHYGWYYYYQLIVNANTIILNIDKATGPEEERKYIKAAALTFRAYSYEKLLRYYAVRWLDSNNGTARGLPLRLDESTGDLPASTMAEVYAQIYKDLDEAIALFGSTTFTRPVSDIWLPNKNVAHAVYARAALNKLDYTKALEQAKLAKEGYPLMSVDDYKSGFCAPTSEWIFGSFGGSTEQLWYWSFGTQFAANGHYATKNNTGAGQISIALLDKVPDTDIRKSLFLTKDIIKDKKAIVNPSNAQIILKNKDGKVNTEVFTAIREWINKNTPSAITSKLPVYAANIYHLGAHIKFLVTDLPGVGYFPFIRTSEMVLIEAEAAFKSGDQEAAKKALVELNKTSGRNPSYTTDKSGDQLWEEIVLYRELELWGEGSSWSDYKRWKRRIDRKNMKNGGNAHNAIAVTIEPNEANNWTYVYPERETQYNKALEADTTKPTP